MARLNHRQKALSKEQMKFRVLVIAKMFEEGRRITVTDILRRLYLQYGIVVDRKTVMSDIYAIDHVIPIDSMMGKNGGYKKFDFSSED